jgi:type IV pilus assembly protein PilQ
LSYSKATRSCRSSRTPCCRSGARWTTDARTNTLIVTDLADRLARATDLITTLDRPEPQVEIEARIIQTTLGLCAAAGRHLGVQRPRGCGARQHAAALHSPIR